VSLLETLLEHLFPPSPEPIRFLRDRLGQRVTIRGRVVPRDLVESPLGGVRCVYYRSLLEEWFAGSRVLGTAGGAWLATWRDEGICEFYVEDGTGRALVIPERAKVVAPADAPRVDVPAGQRGSELVLLPWHDVEVHGVVSEIADVLDEQRGYRDDATRFMLSAPPEGWLVVKMR
jgi:hypothetical protein